MPVITSKPSQAIYIGENVEVRVLRVRNGNVRLGFTAPRDVLILRSELLDLLRRAEIPSGTSQGETAARRFPLNRQSANGGGRGKPAGQWGPAGSAQLAHPTDGPDQDYAPATDPPPSGATRVRGSQRENVPGNGPCLEIRCPRNPGISKCIRRRPNKIRVSLQKRIPSVTRLAQPVTSPWRTGPCVGSANSGRRRAKGAPYRKVRSLLVRLISAGCAANDQWQGRLADKDKQ
ncbi:carbon storage regulator [Lysobacter enzymogenes]|uniref:carbon storage regulator n=1 Tax=Lysobacter enzymogenes TaxID=69 RepID=UPI00099C690B